MYVLVNDFQILSYFTATSHKGYSGSAKELLGKTSAILVIAVPAESLSLLSSRSFTEVTKFWIHTYSVLLL